MTASSEVGGGGTVRRFRRHRWLAAAGLALALAALLAIGAVYAYARSQRDVVARGIHVGTIDLGGLSAGAARIKLERAYRPLERPLVLRYGGGQLVLTARQAKLSLDPRELVARALDLSRRPWFLPRAWRELTGGRVKADLRPRIDYSRSAVGRVVRELQRRIRRPPVNATLVPSFDRLLVKKGRPGVAVAAGLLRAAIVKTLVTRQARRLLEVPIRHPRPRVTPA